MDKNIKSVDIYLDSSVVNDEPIKLNFSSDIKVTVEDDGDIYVVRKDPKWPNTFDECCKCLNITSRTDLVFATPETSEYDYLCDNNCIMNNILKLKICRDAYWKTTNNWEPTYGNSLKGERIKFTIETIDGVVVKSVSQRANKFLSFKTEEARDAFYDNFKDLINAVKYYI